MDNPKIPGRGARFGYAVARMAAFAALGALTARHVSAQPEAAAIGAVSGWILSEVMLLVLGTAAMLFCGARATPRSVSPGSGVRQGFVTMVPFALLALIAEIGLGWDAAQAFVAAGVTASAGAAATELARRGASQLRAVVVATVGGIAFAAAWIVVTLAAQRAGAG